MGARKLDHRRQTSLLWGVLTQITLAGALFAWTVSPSAAATSLFGRTFSIGVVVAAMILTAVGMIMLTRTSSTSGTRRWAVALPIAVVAAGIAVMALGDLFTSSENATSGSWILLLFAAVGMNVTSTHVAKYQASTQSRTH